MLYSSCLTAVLPLVGSALLGTLGIKNGEHWQEQSMVQSQTLGKTKEFVLSTGASGSATQGNFGIDTLWGKAERCCKDRFRGWQCQVPGHGEKFPMAGGVSQHVSGKETHCSWKSKSSQFRCHQ